MLDPEALNLYNRNNNNINDIIPFQTNNNIDLHIRYTGWISFS